jgi:predicted TIM-barrel fold metal-dependent hydrolase
MTEQKLLPAVNDPEGEAVPDSLLLVVDAHVHVFPDVFFEAIWQWFDRFAWPIRYRMKAAEVVEFLFSRKIDRVVALSYAHRPGLARDLNKHMAGLCDLDPRITGFATVFPGEPGAREILEEAFALGLSGVKLHGHLQFFEMDSPALHRICEDCSKHGKPLVMHVGREPKLPAYAYERDPHSLYSADKVERILRGYPELKVCVPHLGADEFQAYRRMIEHYDNLWLDTAMVLADYLPFNNVPNLNEMRVDRIMYGSDFPALPYAWDREIKRLLTVGISEESLARILGQNAIEFLSISRSG